MIIILDNKKFFLNNGYFQYNGYGRSKIGREYLHIYLWKKTNNKPVPQGHVIHHKDGNSLNNNIQNLECISSKEHKALHAKERWSKAKPLKIVCKNCLRSFNTKTLIARIGFCNRSCFSKYNQQLK